MRPTRVQRLPAARAEVYLTRAGNLLKTMELAEKEGNPDGVATNAVQAAIALGDGYTIHFRQERCRGQDHHEVLLLIARCGSPHRGQIGQILSRILDRKGEVEYADRAVSLKEARELASRVRALTALVRDDIR